MGAPRSRLDTFPCTAGILSHLGEIRQGRESPPAIAHGGRSSRFVSEPPINRRDWGSKRVRPTPADPDGRSPARLLARWQRSDWSPRPAFIRRNRNPLCEHAGGFPWEWDFPEAEPFQMLLRHVELANDADAGTWIGRDRVAGQDAVLGYVYARLEDSHGQFQTVEGVGGMMPSAARWSGVSRCR